MATPTEKKWESFKKKTEKKFGLSAHKALQKKKETGVSYGKGMSAKDIKDSNERAAMKTCRSCGKLDNGSCKC